nr:hypothetical protein [Tanacetum cinerariifolium]
MHVDNDGNFSSNTPIGEKIDNIKRQIYVGKLRLLDNDGKSLVPTGRSSYARVMIKLQADVELKDNIVMAMPKITREAIIHVMSMLSTSGNFLGVSSYEGMKHGFLSQKRSEGGRGVKEKDLNRNKKNTSLNICVTTKSNDTMNNDTPIGVAFAIQEGVTPSVVGLTAGNAPGKSSYANITGKPSAKKVNVRTLFTPRGRLSYARVMIKLQADVELKDNIVMAMPKITREGHYTCNVHVEYEWKFPRCSSCMVFGHIHEEYSKNTEPPQLASKAVQPGGWMDIVGRRGPSRVAAGWAGRLAYSGGLAV